MNNCIYVAKYRHWYKELCVIKIVLFAEWLNTFNTDSYYNNDVEFLVSEANVTCLYG